MRTMPNEQIEKIFMTVFNKLPKIDYNPEWSNGTGYFNGAVAAKVDRICASTDKCGRQIVIVPQRDGEFNIVYFRRYKDADLFVVHGSKTVYLEDRARFTHTSAGAGGLWEPDALRDLQMLEELQYVNHF